MKNKKKYTILIEAEVPAIFKYEVLVDSEEELEDINKLLKYKIPVKIEYKVKKKKNIFAKIYSYGTFMLHKAKSLI